jgi:glycosyltransferase involved in cell wall biosynthesis
MENMKVYPADSKVTLGAAIIVKDEAERIERCITSLKLLSQIVILDTGSTDDTCSIIKNLRDNFNYPIDLIENQYNSTTAPDSFFPSGRLKKYSEARNITLLGCHTDWIFILDADEQVPEESIIAAYDAINLINDLDSDPASEFKTDSILCLLNNQFGDMFFNDRIIRRDPEIYLKGRIHEYVLSRKKARDERIQIIFESREKSPEVLQERINIIEEDLRDNPNDTRGQYLAAREYFVRNYLPNAIYWFDRYFRTREQYRNLNIAKAELADAYFTSGWCYLGMGELFPAKERLLECIGVNPDFKEAYIQLAKIAEYEKDPLAQERWELAASTAENKELNFKTKGKY